MREKSAGGRSALSHRASRLFAVLVAAIVVTSGGLFGWLYLTHRSSGSVPPAGDGPTYREALSAVENDLGTTPGGPWTVFGAYGIATPVAFQVASLGWGGEPGNATNACRAAFSGLTIWNGTMPLFDGSYASGTAPFWQFLFFSNASQQIALGTDVLGKTSVDPPIPMTSPCGQWVQARGKAWGWAKFDLTPISVDSPTLAQTVWDHGGSLWAKDDPPSAEMYVFGDNDWAGWPAGILIAFQRCGLVGAGYTQPYADFGVNPDGSSSVLFNGSESCTPEQSVSGPPIPFEVEFSNASLALDGGTRIAEQSLQVYLGPPWTNVTTYGLGAWMFELSLADSEGQTLQSVASGCPTWVSTVSDCEASASGWYAVLITPTGGWLDSYPSPANASGWVDPAGSVLGYEALAIVVPSSWNTTGDVLTVTATTSEVPVTGSATLA